MCFTKISEFVSNKSYQESMLPVHLNLRVGVPRNIYGGESVFDDLPYRLLRGVIVWWYGEFYFLYYYNIFLKELIKKTQRCHCHLY
jgi:hypothetical protein